MDGRGVRASTERGNQTLSFGGNPATWPAGERIVPDMAGTRTVPRMAREMTRVCIIDASSDSLLPPLSRLPSPQLPALRPPASSTSDGIAGLCSDAARWRTEARMPRTADAAKRRGEYEYGEGGWKGRSGQKDRWPNRGQNISRRPSLRVPDARSIAALAYKLLHAVRSRDLACPTTVGCVSPESVIRTSTTTTPSPNLLLLLPPSPLPPQNPSPHQPCLPRSPSSSRKLFIYFLFRSYLPSPFLSRF